MAREAELQAEIDALRKQIDLLKSSEEGRIGSIVKNAAAKLEQAIEELITVRVLTVIGEPSLRAELDRLKNKDAAGFDVAQASGAITSINLVSGDIQTFLSPDALTGPLKTLHDEALEKGTTILRENVRMLADVIGKLGPRDAG
jgi:hypothetical protein